MKKCCVALTGAVGLLGTGLFLIAPGPGKRKEFAPFYCRNVAHRGLYEADQTIPENSLTAFDRAASAGYGIELDLQLSADGRVVVFHDDTLDRMCGVQGNVNDYTLTELRAMRLAGTDEQIPLFSEVLLHVAGRVPMIVELKSGTHNEELCEKAWKQLEAYRGEFCVESFDPRIVKWFRKQVPHVVRGQLACRYGSYKGNLSAPVRFLFSRGLANWMGRPDFIAYQVGKKPVTVRLAEKLGAYAVCWTSHDPENEKHYETVIFEHYLPKVWYNQKS